MTGTGCKLGVAFEFGSDRQCRLLETAADAVHFVEYGLHLRDGFPEWLDAALARLDLGLNLHPLDVNLADEAPPGEPWLAALRAIAERLRAGALVTDMGYWYHGLRSQVWFRPPSMPDAAEACRRNARIIAEACGLRFRVENPPVEWMRGPQDLWAFLEAASDDETVDICLDVSHLLQFEYNVNGRAPVLPADFPWHRVAELHLAGFVKVQYRDHVLCLDQHVAEISGDQLALARHIVTRVRAARPSLDICLEMEPRSPAAVAAVLSNCQHLLVDEPLGAPRSWPVAPAIAGADREQLT
jgi:uncharacterized protein (UPF0276 family)